MGQLVLKVLIWKLLNVSSYTLSISISQSKHHTSLQAVSLVTYLHNPRACSSNQYIGGRRGKQGQE